MDVVHNYPEVLVTPSGLVQITPKHWSLKTVKQPSEESEFCDDSNVLTISLISLWAWMKDRAKTLQSTHPWH